VVSLGGVSTAGLLGRLMLILFFAVQLGWLPTSGYGGLQYVILPAIGWRCARWADQPGRPQRDDQRCRSSTWSPHAPRDSRAHVVFSHALKNAFIPVITLGGDEAAALLNGAVVIERCSAAWRRPSCDPGDRAAGPSPD